MKKVILILFFVIIYLTSNSQTKLCYDVYYYTNPLHKQKKYENILVITNASYKALKEMKGLAKKKGYKVTFSTEVFPPIKDYTDEEVKQIISAKGIDAILYYTITGTEVTSSVTYGSYTMPVWGVVSSNSSTRETYFTSIKAVFVEVATPKEKEFYCDGGANGTTRQVTCRVFQKLLAKLDDVGIAFPNK